MRLLSGGADHVRCRAVAEDEEAERYADRRGDGRQSLSLRYVHAHPACDSSRGGGGVAMNVVKVNRRDFVKITSAASAGLVLALQMPNARAAQDEEYPLGAFVQIGTDGLVTIYVAKSDMGQGVRTALPMIVADEMDADWT